MFPTVNPGDFKRELGKIYIYYYHHRMSLLVWEKRFTYLMLPAAALKKTLHR